MVPRFPGLYEGIDQIRGGCKQHTLSTTAGFHSKNNSRMRFARPMRNSHIMHIIPKSSLSITVGIPCTANHCVYINENWIDLANMFFVNCLMTRFA